MISIKAINNQWLSMTCHYSYRERCRRIPGADFNYEKKAWVAPMNSLPAIQQEFQSEIYYITPQWKLEGKEEPPKQVVELLGPRQTVPQLQLKPFQYQVLGIQFMIDRINNLGFCMNGDGVGLGKTIQSIGTLKWFVENRGVRKTLIVCKKSIKAQWASEIRKFTGWQKVPIFVTGDTKQKRLKAYKGMQDSIVGILITNYQNFLSDMEEINKVNYDFVIIDEAHTIKSRDGKMNNNIGSIARGRRTILLTGTPILSKPDDIWGIVNMASPNYFGTYKDFEQRYLVKEFGIYGEQIVGAKNLNELQDSIKSFLIRRTGEEVALDLPEVLPPRQIVTEADEVQKNMLSFIQDRKEKLDEKKRELLNNSGNDPRVIPEIDKLNEKGKQYLAISQLLSDDPGCLRYLNTDRGLNKQLISILPKEYIMSEKTRATIDIVSDILSEREKVIIFCHFASAARMLRDQICKELKVNIAMYTGAENDETREKNKTAFLESDEVNILIGTEACAEGLNLQKAKFMIMYENADTYAQRNQRIGRMRRIGSPFDYLIVYDMITENTFDTVKIRKIARDKLIAESLVG